MILLTNKKQNRKKLKTIQIETNMKNNFKLENILSTFLSLPTMKIEEAALWKDHRVNWVD